MIDDIRKVRIVYFTPDILLAVCRDGWKFELPSDAITIRSGYDHKTGNFWFHIWSRGFDPIPAGNEIPEFIVFGSTPKRQEEQKNLTPRELFFQSDRVKIMENSGMTHEQMEDAYLRWKAAIVDTAPKSVDIKLEEKKSVKFREFF